MAKNTKNYVAAAKFLAIAEHLAKPENEGDAPKLVIENQKGFVKITRPGIEGKAVYVGNGKGVARIDLSGFRLDIEGLVPHNKPPTSKVEQMVDFNRDEILVLKTFADTIKLGLSAESQVVVGKRAVRQATPEVSPEELQAAVALACG